MGSRLAAAKVVEIALRLGHLSDLHLTAGDGDARSEPRLWGRLRGMNGRLRALIRGCAELRTCDAILVTGDVTDRRHVAAWERLHREAVAAGLERKLVVLAGNHDVSCLTLRDRPAPEDRARARAGLALLGQPARTPWARELVPGLVVLLAVDSTVAGNATGLTNARGRLGERQLVDLGRLLARHQSFPVKLVALHHSPNIPLAATSRRRGQPPRHAVERYLHEIEPADRRTLRVLCRTWGVRAVLHGHTHDGLDRRVGGVRMIGAPATTEPDASGALRFKRYLVGARPPHRIVAETISFSP